MSEFAQLTKRWKHSLCEQVPVAGLLSRCGIAYKWKAPYRSFVVREALFWRMHDLGEQIVCLMEGGHILGQRILIRSALETTAILIYLNHKVSSVVKGEMSFFEFDKVTKQLLMGSKNSSTSIPAVNVLSVLKHADKAWPGILEMHEHLSETAHPNYSGVLHGYCNTDVERFESNFCNHFAERFGEEQLPAALFVYHVFEHEYNSVFCRNIEALECWLRDNDHELEARRAGI